MYHMLKKKKKYIVATLQSQLISLKAHHSFGNFKHRNIALSLVKELSALLRGITSKKIMVIFIVFIVSIHLAQKTNLDFRKKVSKTTEFGVVVTPSKETNIQ